jgi:hypothetical protein
MEWAPLATLTSSSLVGRERKLNEKFDESATDSSLHSRRVTSLWLTSPAGY